MKFDERFIEELKSRLRPSDVIGRTVKLKRQGREFAGLSPFTKEKSPSFFVNDEKGFFHDFSSGKHGDIISFLQETERLSFVEAVERLANEAGVALPAPDPQAAAREQRRSTLFDWTELAMKWFSANLRRSVGAGRREYLKKRGLPEDQWERFGLGYAPNDRDGLKTALIQQGATPGDLVEDCTQLAPILHPVSERIATHGGAALIVDYGDWHSLGDTLQALQGHEKADPLAAPGQADLTAHVDFEKLALAAAPASHTRITPQGVFLERLGITQRAQTLAKGMIEDALNAHVAAHRRLTHPSEMGNLFKVMGIYPPHHNPPPGLEP